MTVAAYPTVPLREVCESIEYGYTASSTTEPVGPRFLRITDIVPERLDWESVPFCEIEPKKLAKHRLRTGDIVIARTGATTGWAKFIKDPPDAVFASYLVRVQPAASVDARFVGFVVESSVYKDFIQQHMGGAAQPNANAQILTSYEIPVPPLPVQRRIAGILSAYDELMENSQRRIRILEAMAHSLYREWFVQFRFPGHEKLPRVASPLGDIPQGWEVKSLNDLVDDIVDYRGKTPKKLNGDWSDEGILALSALNVKGGRLVSLEKSRCVNEDLYSRWMKNPLRRGDILMTSEAPLGELYFLCKEERYCLSQRLFSLRANSRVIAPVILYLSMESEQTQHELRSRASGATVSGIRQSELRKITIVVPPRSMQERAAPILQRLAEQKFTLDAQIQNLRQTRDLLLPRLLSGQLGIDRP